MRLTLIGSTVRSTAHKINFLKNRHRVPVILTQHKVLQVQTRMTMKLYTLDTITKHADDGSIMTATTTSTSESRSCASHTPLVTFSDVITVHEIAPIDSDLLPTLLYTEKNLRSLNGKIRHVALGRLAGCISKSCKRDGRNNSISKTRPYSVSQVNPTPLR
jgi:hypothetical protein